MGGVGGAGFARPRHCAAAPFPVRFRKASPHETLARYILPGNDEFAGEKPAMEIEALLRRLPETGTLPLAPDFRGSSPLPSRYRTVAADCFVAEFDAAEGGFVAGFRNWARPPRAPRPSPLFGPASAPPASPTC